MALADILFLLRRYRLIVLLAVVGGLAAGWITAPGDDAEPQQFEATHTLILNPQSRTTINVQQAALLATRGAVVEVAATALGEDPRQITRSVTARGLDELSAVEITGRSEDRDQAADRANAVATALIDDLAGAELDAYQQQIDAFNEQITELQARVAAGSDGSPAGESALSAATSDLSTALQQKSQLEREGAPVPPLESVEEAQARAADDGIQAPKSKPVRAALLAFFGLLVGLGAAFALDRLDTRIHTKEAAESAFGFPVIAEIPQLPPGASPRELLASSRPSAHVVEAFRGLRAYVTLAGQAQGLRPPDEGKAPVILVTSPLAGEGKTTAAAHLAVLLGEVERPTLVVSGDFRRPRLQDLFGKSRSPGLTEVLSGTGTPDASSLDLATSHPNVQFLASGAPTSTPAVVVKRVPPMLRAAQSRWDFIVVDSAPLLVANDTLDLARSANGVVVLARSGRTSIAAAKRAAEVLRRVEAPVLGIVLIGVTAADSSYRYYYEYRDDPAAGGRRLGRRGRGSGRGSSKGGSPNRVPTTEWGDQVAGSAKGP